MAFPISGFTDQSYLSSFTYGINEQKPVTPASTQPQQVSLTNQPKSESAGEQRVREYTTVTTHCNKEHQHTPSCPHTTTTRPAFFAGKLDILV